MSKFGISNVGCWCWSTTLLYILGTFYSVHHNNVQNLCQGVDESRHLCGQIDYIHVHIQTMHSAGNA